MWKRRASSTRASASASSATSATGSDAGSTSASAADSSFSAASLAARGARSAASASAASRLPSGPAAVGVDGDRTRHHRAPGQRAVERLPGQVVADVQPVQPVGGLKRPRADQQEHDSTQRDDRTDDQRVPVDATDATVHQLAPATCTLAPAPATVS